MNDLELQPVPPIEADSAVGACLVTGSAGFIGRRLVRELRASGVFSSVLGVDANPTDDSGDVTCTLNDLGHLQVDSGWRFTHCVHLAAVAKEPGYEHGEYYATNDHGTEQVLRLCDRLGIRNLVFTSTMMVFPAGEVAYSETDQVAPDTAYGGSKALAEASVKHWAAVVPGRRSVVLRPGVVFGPGDPGNFTRMLHALQKGRFAFIGRRDTVKSCVHVDDVVGFVRFALDNANTSGTFHLAFPGPTRIDEIVAEVKRAFGITRPVPCIPLGLALAAARVIASLPTTNRLGVHPRRIEKLNRSTHIRATTWLGTGYKMRYSTLGAAVDAWAVALTDCDLSESR